MFGSFVSFAAQIPSYMVPKTLRWSPFFMCAFLTVVFFFTLEALPCHPRPPLIPYSPHLLLHSISLLSTGICLGISRWKLYSISGAPYQHTIIMGNHAEQCWIQLGLPLWWHYWLQGPAPAEVVCSTPTLYLSPFLLLTLFLLSLIYWTNGFCEFLRVFSN